MLRTWHSLRLLGILRNGLCPFGPQQFVGNALTVVPVLHSLGEQIHDPHEVDLEQRPKDRDPQLEGLVVRVAQPKDVLVRPVLLDLQ